MNNYGSQFSDTLLGGGRLTFGSLLDGPGVTLAGLLGTFGLLWGVLPGRPRASLLGGFGSPGLSLGFLWCFFAYTGLQGGSLSSTLHISLFFIGNVHVFYNSSICFLTLERGRGRAAGAAEDHTKCKKCG